MENQGLVRRSLKEKLHEHWNTRDQILSPKPQSANKIGKAFTLIFSLVLTVTISCRILPELNLDHGLCIQSMTWIFCLSALWNWALCCMDSSNVTKEKLTAGSSDSQYTKLLPEGWKYCAICQSDAPPRSHHCKICQLCILKRDHHCFFTGTCIGWSNQRRFIVFVFYCFLGALNGIWLIMLYLYRSSEDWTSHYYYYLPGISLFSWLHGIMSFGEFFLLLELYASCMILLMSCCFLLWEMSMVLRGQTSYEAARGINKYRCGLLEGFHSVFGNYGLIHFVLPLNLPQQGDGVNWPIYEYYKSH